MIRDLMAKTLHLSARIAWPNHIIQQRLFKNLSALTTTTVPIFSTTKEPILRSLANN